MMLEKRVLWCSNRNQFIFFKKQGCRYYNLQPNTITIVYFPKNVKMQVIM